MADRERVGREAGPTGCILDAQAARSGGVGVAGERGYDPAKRVVGRKRHALTDTDGRLLVAAVSPANLHDSHGGIALLRASRGLGPFLAHCFADRAYQGERVGSASAITVEIVQPEEGQTGFAVQPRRWVIERTFGWIARCRRMARDYEATPSSALAFFVLAAAMILLRRLDKALSNGVSVPVTSRSPGTRRLRFRTKCWTTKVVLRAMAAAYARRDHCRALRETPPPDLLTGWRGLSVDLTSGEPDTQRGSGWILLACG